MDYRVKFSTSQIKGTIKLPFSKSISNRLLVIRALTSKYFQIHNISESDDTVLMNKAFLNNDAEVNIGHAGTAMRFLTAFFSSTEQKKIITGSERMKNRPIGELVDALNSLGAEIEYLEKQGYPPVETSGKPLVGKEIKLRGSISSQYITALLLIAPVLPEGLTIHISDTLISSSYVKLTLGIMKDFGIKSSWENNTISIPHQQYSSHDYSIEADWSGASYWYSIAMLSDTAEIVLYGLFQDSFQGDASIVRLFEKLGITTEYISDGVVLRKSDVCCNYFTFDFIDNPDMVQTFVVSLCLKGIPFRLTGAQTLRIKETDRIIALQQEMLKLGFVIQETQPGVLEWDGTKNSVDTEISIETYDDHRMALAFAPAALIYPGIVIKDAQVVSKSYPEYWKDIQSVGAILE